MVELVGACVCFSKWCHIADLTLQPALFTKQCLRVQALFLCFSQFCSVPWSKLAPVFVAIPLLGTFKTFLGDWGRWCLLQTILQLNILMHVWHTCKYFSSYREVEWLGHGEHTIQILMGVAGSSPKWLGQGMFPPAVGVSMSLPPAHIVIMSSCYMSADLMGGKGHLTLIEHHLDY